MDILSGPILNRQSTTPRLESVHEAIVSASKRYVVAYGGRGSGKSWTIANAIALRCTLAPTRVVAMRQKQNSISKSSKATIEGAIRGLGLGGWRLGAYKLTHANGSEITFQGLDRETSDSIRSVEGTDVFWIEEAHSIERTPLEVLLPTVRKSRALAVFSLNPVDPQQCVYFDFVAEPDWGDDLLAVEANWDSNPFLDAAVLRLKDREYRRDPEKAEHIWGGKPLLISAAQVFRYQRHWWLSDLDDEIPDNAVALYGLDIGMGQHPSVILQVWAWDDVIYVSKEAVDDDLTQDTLQDFVASVGVREGDVVFADHQSLPWNRAPAGWSMKHVPKKPGGEDRGVKWLKSKRIFVHPACDTTRFQMARYSYKVDVNENILPEYADENDDAPDCIRYALHQQIYALRAARQVPLMGGVHY